MDYEKINEDFYSNRNWGLDRSRNKWFSKYVKAKIFKMFLKDVERGVLYDAGGGVGNWGSFLGKDFKKIIVSDISKKALNQIPEKNIIKIKCSVLKNELSDNSVNAILLMDVFEHIEEKDLETMMKDFNRILKRRGVVLVYTSLYGRGCGSFWQRIFNPSKRLIGNEHSEGHVNRLKFSEMKRIFQNSNFEIEKVYVYAVILQQLTDALKDGYAKFMSRILGRGKKEELIGKKGQSIKEDMRKKEENFLLKNIFRVLSYISYFDIYLGKIYPGNAIFLKLKKK